MSRRPLLAAAAFFAATASLALGGQSAQAHNALGPPVIVKGFPPSPLGQVPDSVIKFTKLDTSKEEHEIEFQNAGTRPIRAVVIRLIDQNAGMLKYAGGPKEGMDSKMPKRGQILWWIRETKPLAQGEKSSVNVFQEVNEVDMANQVEICAVIFADGTHVGSAPDPIRGQDAVADIFEMWQGRADAEAAWKKEMAGAPKDNHAWLEKFLSKAESFDENEGSYSLYNAGEREVAGGLQALAQRVRGEVSKGVRSEASARSLIQQRLDANLARTATLATNAGKADLTQGAGK
jgi:hypothetical protein